MIPKYINDWLTIIETMSNQNTYKLAWGRSIVEYVNLSEIDESKEYFEFKLIDAAELVLKYYWNQIFFFDLKQVPEKGKAKIIIEVKKLISLYEELVDSNNPKWFQDGKEILKDRPEYSKGLKKIANLLKENPTKYFLNASVDGSRKTHPLPIYIRDDANNRILIKTEDAKTLKEYGIIIAKLLKYKWTQLLEKYNFVPMLSNKVTAISIGKIDRNELIEYKKQLIKEFSDGKIRDFYTGEELTFKEATVDHVIPWSFMYSDDIWNLVLTSQSNNSSKSNIVPSQEVIDRLKERNARIKNIVDDIYQKELTLAEINHSVDNYYYECKVAK